MRTMNFAVVVASAIIGITGCVRPAQDRAERDRTVGQATNGALSVRVSDGLAAVRKLETERVLLWASAPAWELELDAVTDGTLTLDIHNCVADAELTALGPDTRVTPLSTELPTRKSFTLDLPAGTSRFRLAPADYRDRAVFRFALMSDVQEAIDRVQDVYRRVNDEDVRFLLGAGDLTRRGTRAELERFRDELEGLDVPYYTTLGNHELGESPALYQDYYGRANFQFVYRGVYFTLLDSASATLDPTSSSGAW